MNKKLRIACTFGLALSCTTFFASCAVIKANATEPETKTYYVDFFNNYLREEFTLSSGFVGKGNNIIYKTIEVAEGALVPKPEDPTRKNYDFVGWFKDEEGFGSWDFATETVTENVRLFAKWTFASEELDPEPEFTPPSTVLEDSAPTDYVIDSIMHFEVEEGVVKVSSAALAKLDASKDNVLPLIEYRVKNGKTISATYNNGNIVVVCGESTEIIEVEDDSENLKVDNANYETKAKKYESNALEEESYHVMLAGSSSIEFWESSKEDLEPIVSYNHGIGGTTIEDWDAKLNKRLVYPYKPKMVVYYVGINNVINSHQTGTTIWTNLEKLMNHTHEAMPNTKVQYIMMNLLPGYPDYVNTINYVNNCIMRYQVNNSSWLTLINPGSALLKEVEGAEGTMSVGDKVDVISNIELQAVWADGEDTSEHKYVVSFNANEAEGTMADVSDIYGTYTLPECTFIAPKDMHFVGWKVNGQGKNLNAGSKITVASNIELVAQWEGAEPEEAVQTYKVRFNANGGTGEMVTVDGVLGKYQLPGCYFNAPEGKHFAGWRVCGDPNAAYFRTDGLHLSHYGYVIWGSIIRQSILDGLKG